MARGAMAVIRLQRVAADHGWTRDGNGEHYLWTRGEERVSAGFDSRGAVKWAFLDSVPVEARGKAEAVLARFVEPPWEG
jgi:hypothetical protein